MEGHQLQTNKSNDAFRIPYIDCSAKKGSKHCKRPLVVWCTRICGVYSTNSSEVTDCGSSRSDRGAKAWRGPFHVLSMSWNYMTGHSGQDLCSDSRVFFPSSFLFRSPSLASICLTSSEVGVGYYYPSGGFGRELPPSWDQPDPFVR